MREEMGLLARSCCRGEAVVPLPPGSDQQPGAGRAAPYPEPDPLTCCVVDCGAEFDTKGRQPVAAACVCGNLTCKKCGEVAASLPSPSPCCLCGRAAQAPPEAGGCKVDVGVLVTVHRAARVTDR
jgi:hypothetical protein